MRYILFLLLPCPIFACAETRARQVEPDRPLATIEPPRPTSVVATAVPPPGVSAAQMHDPPDTDAAIGDVTCSTDADCTVTTRLQCCACCDGPPRATSRAWLTWRDGTECPKSSCKPCGKRDCQTPADASAFVAVCDLSQSIGRCSLARKR